MSRGLKPGGFLADDPGLKSPGQEQRQRMGAWPDEKQVLRLRLAQTRAKLRSG
jgi:hypothetical protein